MQSPDDDLIRNIYIDESSQNQHRFLVLGGIIAPRRVAEALNVACKFIRRKELPGSELKWTKVSLAKLEAYQQIVDQFFIGEWYGGPVEFHCLVVEMARRNEHAFNSGNREIGFNKEIYQLLMKFGRLYGDCLFHVYPDKRETNTPLDEIRLMLNRGIKKKGDQRDWPFRRLHFRGSHDEPLLQLTDLLIGAVAFHLNGHRKVAGASPAKCWLSDYILDKARVLDPARDTAVKGKFTIWHRQMRGVPRP